MNYLPAALLPYKVVDPSAYGYGFGLGSRVLINVAESEKPENFKSCACPAIAYLNDERRRIVKGLRQTTTA
jgi:hypothetical protein